MPETMIETGLRTRPFWAELRERREQGVRRAELRSAIELAGERFCRDALASSEPFARSCAAEAGGTRGPLREALVALAAGGGRRVARELARRRQRQLYARLDDAGEVDAERLEAALAAVGREPVERLLAGEVGFRSACLFEAALRPEDGAGEGAWLALAGAGVRAVRRALERTNGPAREALPVLSGAPTAAPAPTVSEPWRGDVLEPQRAGAVLIHTAGEEGEGAMAAAMREALAAAA